MIDGVDGESAMSVKTRRYRNGWEVDRLRCSPEVAPSRVWQSSRPDRPSRPSLTLKPVCDGQDQKVQLGRLCRADASPTARSKASIRLVSDTVVVRRYSELCHNYPSAFLYRPGRSCSSPIMRRWQRSTSGDYEVQGYSACTSAAARARPQRAQGLCSDFQFGSSLTC